ncbi:MAG: twin-arginine translocation signal domain-containing protein, partial [Chloroflexi bacterium]|nr:twin-arginine translocation signal domain-containing protein [Chloroflexota bacterium]
MTGPNRIEKKKETPEQTGRPGPSVKVAGRGITRRQFLHLAGLAAAGAAIAGCGVLPGVSGTPTPPFTPTPVTFAQDTARAFLKAWDEGDYNAMYQTLAPSRKETTTVDQFVARYKDTADEATFT